MPVTGPNPSLHRPRGLLLHRSRVRCPGLATWTGILIMALMSACGPDAAPSPGDDAADPAEGLRFDLGIDRAQYAPGDSVQVRIRVENHGEVVRNLSFPDARRADVEIVDAAGEVVARWSDDRAFAQVLGEETLRPGDGGLSWELALEAPAAEGAYRLRGVLVASEVRLETSLPFQVGEGGEADPEMGRPGGDAVSLARTWNEALPWTAFLDGVEARRDLWMANWSEARIPGELLERTGEAGGPWRILAIAEDACSDSASSIPYLARLAEASTNLELRVVGSDAGRPWMERHRTPDGRAATPTVLVLDDRDRVAGCWVEQPAELQAFWLDLLASGEAAREVGRKMAWYADDEGRETLREFVEVLEGARAGTPVCPGL
jgi:hypothetical protein